MTVEELLENLKVGAGIQLHMAGFFYPDCCIQRGRNRKDGKVYWTRPQPEDEPMSMTLEEAAAYIEESYNLYCRRGVRHARPKIHEVWIRKVGCLNG